MIYDSLIPEAPILVYPSLAASIGLEPATMLSLLTQFARQNNGQTSNGYQWHLLKTEHIQALFPFWQAADIQRVSTSLREQGLLLLASAPFLQSGQLKFALNESQARLMQRQEQNRQNHAKPTNPGQHRAPLAQANLPSTNLAPGKNLISPSWTPDRETLNQLAQHNIPSQFAMDQVQEFVRYWRERGETAHSWGSKFFKQVKRNWERYRAQEHAQNSQTSMYREWRPSADAMEVLTIHAEISRDFIEDAIPEFVLYWREQGARSDNWNKKFRDHVQRQWLRYCSALEHDPTPKLIPDNWQPSNDVYEVLRLANIDESFARQLVAEFVIYWRDSNQVHNSWNTRFLQFVKQRWAKRSSPDQQPHKSTRDLSLAEQLTDRSWAL